jgi:hypothetical protein
MKSDVIRIGMLALSVPGFSWAMEAPEIDEENPAPPATLSETQGPSSQNNDAFWWGLLGTLMPSTWSEEAYYRGTMGCLIAGAASGTTMGTATCCTGFAGGLQSWLTNSGVSFLAPFASTSFCSGPIGGAASTPCLCIAACCHRKRRAKVAMRKKLKEAEITLENLTSKNRKKHKNKTDKTSDTEQETKETPQTSGRCTSPGTTTLSDLL